MDLCRTRKGPDEGVERYMSEHRLASVSRGGPIVASATLLTLLSIQPVLCQPHTFIPPFPGSWPIDNGYRTVCSLNVPQTTIASCRNSIDRDRSDLNTLHQSRLAGTIKDSSSYATLRLGLEKHLNDSLQVLRSLQSRQMTPPTQSVPRQSSYLLSPEQGGQGNYQDVNWAGDEVRMAYTASAASESIIGVSGTITVPAFRFLQEHPAMEKPRLPTILHGGWESEATHNSTTKAVQTEKT